MALRMRDDAVTDGGQRDAVLANAPERAGAVLRRAEGGRMMLTDLTIAAARDGLRQREFSARELTEAHLAAIEALNPRLNAYLAVTADAARQRADAADAGEANGPLAGIPLAIKDLFCTKGVRTTAGSRILEPFVPPYESTVTANLLRDGAVFLGKANLDEFAMGSSNMTSAFGPVENPWKRRQEEAAVLVPGGSSGGSAAAVASGLAMGATGTDTGGSIRQPASFCGIAGMKPTYGRCSRWGVVAFASSLDHPGPFGAHRRGLRDPARLDGRVRSEGQHLGGPRGAGLRRRLRARRSRPQDRRAARVSRGRDGGRNRGVVAAGARLAARRGGRDRRCVAAAHAIRPGDLLYRRPRRGVVQPRAL